MSLPSDLLRATPNGRFSLAWRPMVFSFSGDGPLAFQGGPSLLYEVGGKRHHIAAGQWRAKALPSPPKSRDEETFLAEGDTDHLVVQWSLTLGSDACLYSHLTLTAKQPGVRLVRAGLFTPHGPETSAALSSRALVYDMGYQSWSFAGLRPLHGKSLHPGIRLVQMGSYNAALRYSGRPGHHPLHWAGAMGDPDLDQWLFMGAASANTAVTTVQVRPEGGGYTMKLVMDLDGVELSPNRPFVTDEAMLSLGPDLNRHLNRYARRTALNMGSRVKGQPPSGVCTWYEVFTKVRERDVTDAVFAMDHLRKAVPVDLIQLDDGWQKDIGDWGRTNRKFRKSLAPMVAEVTGAGFTPGLWFAPFYVRPTARPASEHPDWLLQDHRGKPLRAGFNPLWGGNVLAWDPSHPEVVERLVRWTERFVEEWGFRFLKMDFLFAGFLPGARHRRDLTRVQSARQALCAIRKAAGDKTFLLGCGMPILPAVGIFDGMRIGPDTAPEWDNAFLHFFAEGAHPSARWAVRTPLMRQWMHGSWWQNDPDCILVRDKNTSLTHHQRLTSLRTILMTGGLRLVGDLPQRLSKTPLRELSRCMGPWPLATTLPRFEESVSPDLVQAVLPGDRHHRRLLLPVNLGDATRAVPPPPDLAEQEPLLVFDVDAPQTERWEQAPEVLAKLRPGHHRLMLVGPVPEVPCFFAGSWSDSAGLGEWRGDKLEGHTLLVTLESSIPRTGVLHLFVPPHLTVSTSPPKLPSKGATERFHVSFTGRKTFRFTFTPVP